MIVNPEFFDHWKTGQLAGELDNDPCAPIYVMRLWAHCQRAKRWRFPDLSASAVKGICKFPGSAEQLWLALQSSGFVILDGQTVIVHEWEVYNASLVAAWENGARGGRPVTHGKPKTNPQVTHGLTQAKPMGKPIGLDRIGEDKIRNADVGRNGAPDDAAWLLSLASDPAYAGIDTATEVAKCRRWCETNRKQASRRRIVNWLNRVDKPIGQTASRPKPNAYSEPPGWQGAIIERYPATDLAEKVRAGLPWLDVPHSVRTELTSRPP